MKVGQAGVKEFLGEVEPGRSNDDAGRLSPRPEPPLVQQERQRLDVPPALMTIGPRPADGQRSSQLPRPRGARLLPPGTSVLDRSDRGLHPHGLPSSSERRLSVASDKAAGSGANALTAPASAGVVRHDGPAIQLQGVRHTSGRARDIDWPDADLPYKKRQKVREQYSGLPQASAQGLAGAQDAQAPRPAVRDAEKSLWHCGRQRRKEFGDLHSKYPTLSGPAFLRVIRGLTDAARPLDVLPSTVRNDIRLFRISVPGHRDGVYVLRRDAGGELRDLRRLTTLGDDGKELGRVIAQMEKSAFQSHGRSAAARGKSVSHPHLSDLWDGGRRKEEFQVLYEAYRRFPGKLDTTGGSFLAELHQLTVNAERRGCAQETGVAGIQSFKIEVSGTSDPVHVLRRLDSAGGMADIRWVPPACRPEEVQEILDQMIDSHAASRGTRRVSSAPRRDRRLSGLWRHHLASRLAGALENFRRRQPDGGSAGPEAFVRHLDKLCDESPAQPVDERFGITRHVVTPSGSKQPVTLLRRKDEGELARMRVIDDNLPEDEALRSLRAVGPKRSKPDAAACEGPGKRRKTQEQPAKPVRQPAGKMAQDEAHLADPWSLPPARKGEASRRMQSGTAGTQLHKVIVPQQHKQQTVDVTYLVTGAVDRIPRGFRTLDWAYANSEDLIRPPRSYEGDRERQALRWLSTVLLRAYPGGREVQSSYDPEGGKIWISSNSRGTNRAIRMMLGKGGLQGKLQEQVQPQAQTLKSYPKDRWARHALRLHRVLNDQSARHPDMEPVLKAMAENKFRVPSEKFHVGDVARQLDLHAERRIQLAFESETGTTMDPAKVVGTKRACGTCAEVLRFPDTERRGPFWRSSAARAFVDMTSVVDACLEKGIPTYVSRGRDEKLNLYVSDSDSDTELTPT